MRRSRKNIVLLFLALCGAAFGQSAFAAKKFKRALVIAGGGISPGVGLGVIAGVQEAGWKPDLVISTCGASIASAIYNEASDSRAAYYLARSSKFHQVLRQISVSMDQGVEIYLKIKEIQNSVGVVDFFSKSILHFPTTVPAFAQRNQFLTRKDGPRLIMVGAQASFGPKDVGRSQRKGSIRETYFTDSVTARDLEGRETMISKMFPESYVDRKTAVISDVAPVQAMRASITDPFLLNPPTIKGSYYFTGAVDLHPIELAKDLAEEVIVTYPLGLYRAEEDMIVEKAFGYSPNARFREVIKEEGVRWVDMYGIEDISFDPVPSFSLIANNVPENLIDFKNGIKAQFDFGYARGQEAIKVGGINERRHLRRPILCGAPGSGDCRMVLRR